MSITVRVKLFAILRDKAGVAEFPLELPEGATVATAAGAIAHRYPDTTPYLPRVAYAVNAAYAPATTVLQDNDELALIPPVSGG